MSISKFTLNVSVHFLRLDYFDCRQTWFKIENLLKHAQFNGRKNNFTYVDSQIYTRLFWNVIWQLGFPRQFDIIDLNFM